MYNNFNHGYVTLITGPMFAGKSEELLRLIRRLQHGSVSHKIFKPKLDSRDKDSISTRSGDKISATLINNPSELMEYIKKETKVVIIDEIQFFNNDIVKVINKLADKGIHVIVGGLDRTFTGEAFPVIEKLMPTVEEIIKLTGVCHKCKAPSTMSQRIINGKPAGRDDATIIVDDKKSVTYETRCRKCHTIK